MAKKYFLFDLVKNIFLKENIDKIHIELTSKCALSCSRCSRTLHPKSYEAGELPLPALENIIYSPQFKRAKLVILSGNFGDPIYHSKFYEIIQFLKNNKKQIHIVTNGSGRPKDWWNQIVPLFTNDDKIIFSIDGLEDTNHLYRKGSDWLSIQNAVSAMSKSQAYLIWKFIVFRHNQYQITAAKQLAKTMGFHEFELIKSNRFGAYYTQNGDIDPLEPSQEFLSKKLLLSRLRNFNKLPKNNILPRCKSENLHFFSSSGHYYPCPAAAINFQNDKNNFWENLESFNLANKKSILYKQKEYKDFKNKRNNFSCAHSTCQIFCGYSVDPQEQKTTDKESFIYE